MTISISSWKKKHSLGFGYSKCLKEISRHICNPSMSKQDTKSTSQGKKHPWCYNIHTLWKSQSALLRPWRGSVPWGVTGGWFIKLIKQLLSTS